MIQLTSCSSCEGFLGLAVTRCPHCGVALGRARRVVAGLAGLAGGGAVSMTLMACYGPGCVSEKCGDYEPDYDAGRTAADAHVNPLDGASLDASDDAEGGATDAGLDGALDAPADGPHDAALDGPSDAADAGG
ncbi:MAG: hypothetical protein U0235_20525 [Polyangiaceae bacterium]